MTWCAWFRMSARPPACTWGDRIRLELRVPQDKGAWTGAHLDLIKREVGCVDASVIAAPGAKEPTAAVEKVTEKAAETARPDPTRPVDYFTNTSGVMQDKVVARPPGPGRAMALLLPGTASLISLAGACQAAETVA